MMEQQRKTLDGVQQTLAWLIFLDLLLLTFTWLFQYQSTFGECFKSLIGFVGIWFCWEARKDKFLRVVGVVIACAWLLNHGAIPSAQAAENVPMGEWLNKGDAASSFLCATIGDPVGLFGCAGTETAIWPALKTFNIAVFSLASLWMIWLVISATISSAADGEFLGKNRSGTWVPLRLVVGFAMITPAFSGFNLAQLIMLWATAVGSGIAGTTAVAVSEKMNFGAIYSAPAVMRASAVEADIVEGLRCLKGWTQQTERLNQEEKKDLAAADPEMPPPNWAAEAGLNDLKWGLQTITENGELRINMGAQPARAGYAETECAQVVITLPATASSDTGVAQIVAGISALVSNEIGGLIDAYKKIIDSTENEADQAAQFADARKQFDTKLATEVRILVAAANQFAGSSEVIRAEIKKAGWIGLGFQGLHATKAAYEVASATQAEVKKTKGGKERTEVKFSVTNIKAWFEAQINNALNDMVDSIGNSVANSISDLSGKNPMAALQGLGVSLISWVAGFAIFVMLFPLIATTSAALLAAGAALPFVGGAAQTAATIITGATQSAHASLLSVLTIIGVPLAFFGLKLAAYIPFLVAIMWAGAILAWLMIVFEALVGAPLWALVHLDLEGEGMGQRTTHGYIFLLNLLLRPVVLVFSLAASMLAMSAVFGLLGGGIAAMITDMSSRSNAWFANLLMIVGAVFVIVMAGETIIVQSLSFLWNIPNNVFTWLGGSFGSNVGQGMEGGANAAGAAIQGVGGSVGGMMSASAGRKQAASAQKASAAENATNRNHATALAGAESARMDQRFGGLNDSVLASAPQPEKPNRPLHNKNRKPS